MRTRHEIAVLSHHRNEPERRQEERHKRRHKMQDEIILPATSAPLSKNIDRERRCDKNGRGYGTEEVAQDGERQENCR